MKSALTTAGVLSSKHVVDFFAGAQRLRPLDGLLGLGLSGEGDLIAFLDCGHDWIGLEKLGRCSE